MQTEFLKGNQPVNYKRFGNWVSTLAMLVCLLVPLSGTAQSVNYKKVFNKANALFERGEFVAALDEYKKLGEDYPRGLINQDVLNYRMGMCYYNHPVEREPAIYHFESYLAHTDSVKEAHYFLAKSYHFYHRFDEAISQYEYFRRYVEADQESDEELIHAVITSINREIERCNHGKILVRNPVDVIIDNLGSDVNTENSEYAPVIDGEEAKIVFTRRSPETTGERISPDGDWFEDIYMADILEGSLFASNADTSKKAGYKSIVTNFKATIPQSIGANINTDTHEGGIQFSFDGKKLFIYRDFNVWVSEQKNGVWQKPSQLGDLENVVNTKAYEPSISIGVDENTIYISSDRPGGYGGLDIYKSVRQRDGSWSDAINLGPSINTRMDEDGPYIDPDGKTLYFSSTGHSSMGGYDVFKSVFRGVNWSTPQNLGYPINTAGDDIFFMMTPRYNRAYYSSNKFGGFGKMDIYRLTFANERPPLAEIRGLVLKDDALVPTESKLTIYDMEHNAPIASQESDSLTGDYMLLFGHGKTYQLEVLTPGFAPYRKMFRIPPQAYYYQYYQEIHHIYLTNDEGEIIGQKVVIHNAYFDIDSLLAAADTLPRGSRTEAYQEFLSSQDPERLEEQLRYAELVDVKFYIPEDSLKKMMQNDTNLFVRFDIPEDADIGFLNPTSGITADDIVSGRVPPSELKKLQQYEPAKELFTPLDDRRNIVLTEDVTADSLETAIRELKQRFADPLDPSASIIAGPGGTVISGKSDMVMMLPEGAVITTVDGEEIILPKGATIKNLDGAELAADPKAIATTEEGARVQGSNMTELKVKKATVVVTPSGDEIQIPENSIVQLEEDAIITGAEVAVKDAADAKPVVGGEDVPNIMVLFDFDRHNVKNEYQRKLDGFIKFLKRNKEIEYNIIGHTDAKGTNSYNMALSRQRAMEVYNYMTSRGIDPNRLGISAKGETAPIAYNVTNDGRDNPDGRQLNRRVEFQPKGSPYRAPKVDDPIAGKDEEGDATLPTDEFIVLTEGIDLVDLKKRLTDVSPEEAPRVIVFFDFDRTKVKSEFKRKLEVFGEFMSQNPELEFRVEGHTDHMGPDRYNDYLSLNRANMVVSFMEKEGVPRARLQPIGMSEHTPLAPNSLADGRDNPDGRALNRRVEFHLVANLENSEPVLASGNGFQSITPAGSRPPKGLPEFINIESYNDYVKEQNVLVLSENISKEEFRDRLVEARTGGRSFPTIIVFFDFDKSNVKSEFDTKLATYIEFMKEFPELRFEIEGHTDSKGSDNYNEGLSLRRSQQVIDYLNGAGIVRTRLDKAGQGEREPMAPNEYSDGRDNPEGRALNRRVEFHIIGEGPK